MTLWVEFVKRNGIQLENIEAGEFRASGKGHGSKKKGWVV
jgi:hypothetical protein